MELGALAAGHRAAAEAYEARARETPDDVSRNLYLGVAATYRGLAKDLALAGDVTARIDEKMRTVQSRFATFRDNEKHAADETHAAGDEARDGSAAAKPGQ